MEADLAGMVEEKREDTEADIDKLRELIKVIDNTNATYVKAVAARKRQGQRRATPAGWRCTTWARPAKAAAKSQGHAVTQPCLWWAGYDIMFVFTNYSPPPPLDVENRP